jgi:alcohol dehydrogenase
LVVLRFAVAMRAALFVEPHHIEVGDRPDPAIAEPTDAVVRVVLASVVRVGAL